MLSPILDVGPHCVQFLNPPYLPESKRRHCSQKIIPHRLMSRFAGQECDNSQFVRGVFSQATTDVALFVD